MKITYLGHACFQLTSSSGVTIITDPYTRVGYELPSGLSADIVTVSHGHFDHNYLSAVKAKHVVSQAMNYELEGVKISGFESFHDDKQGALRGKNVLFTIEMDGIKICHFGDLGEACRDDIIEKIADADILLVPIGGTYTIDALQAKKYVEGCKPRIVIPMHYRPTDGSLDIADSTPFLELFEKKDVQKVLDGSFDIDVSNLAKLPLILYMERKQ
ncbi:MAG: MBL fold metallo-hydrolase [Clostridia bacterium]|nr:MBL fold metallo-hydrolase [Clostridia bacterium]